MPVSMKKAKDAPNPGIDPLAHRALSCTKRLFLVLRDQLRKWREARKRRGLEGDAELTQELTRDLSSLGWGSALGFAGGYSGGSSSGGGLRDMRPPCSASAAYAPARAARSVDFVIFMTPLVE